MHRLGRVDLHAELDVELLGPGKQPLDHSWGRRVLDAQHGEAEPAGRLQLRLDVRDDLVLVEEPVGAHSDVDVAVETRQLPAVLVDQPQESLFEVGLDPWEAAEALEADHLETRAKAQLGGSDDEILERVAARVEVGSEAVQRHAEARKRGGRHDAAAAVCVFTQRSRMTSGWPVSTM